MSLGSKQQRFLLEETVLQRELVPVAGHGRPCPVHLSKPCLAFIRTMSELQIHYSSWRRSSKCFWMLVVSYSMVVLFAVYTFQFQAVSGFFNETLGLSEENVLGPGLMYGEVAFLAGSVLSGHLCKAPKPFQEWGDASGSSKFQDQSPGRGPPGDFAARSLLFYWGLRTHGLETPGCSHLGISPDSGKPRPQLAA